MNYTVREASGLRGAPKHPHLSLLLGYLFITFEKCWSKAFYTTPTLSVMDFNRVFSTFQTEVQRDLLEKKILGKGVSPAIAASTPLSSGESKKDI